MILGTILYKHVLHLTVETKLVQWMSHHAQEEVSETSSMEVSTTLIIRGGSAETRAKLYAERTNDLIAQFLSEADKKEPIKYKFTPIWELLETRYLGTDHFAKVRHLQAYYLGRKNFDCPDLKSSPTGAWQIQIFRESASSTPDIPSYECVIPYTGCHRDVECIYGPGAYCRCVGETCFRDVTETTNTDKDRTHVVSNGEYWYKWEGCHLGFFSCSCQNSKINDWRVIWTQPAATSNSDLTLQGIQFKVSQLLKRNTKNEL